MSSPQYFPPVEGQPEPVSSSNAQPPPRRIGIVGNLGKPAALPVARDAIAALTGRVTVCVEQQFADLLEMSHLGADDQELRAADLVLVFGGDGTVLGTSRMVAPSCTPMLGINLGRFGFLNEVAPERVAPAMENLLTGNYAIEERLMLEAHVLRNGEVVETESALNEVVIGHSTLARVMHLSMSINGSYVTTYAADGIIFSTPTGSTAYNLSAGGPLVHPALDVILVTPVCPHTLTTRALVIPPTHEVTVEAEAMDSDYVRVTNDGQRSLNMLSGDILRVRRASFCARIITRVGGASFYEKLQSKLRWGERMVY